MEGVKGDVDYPVCKDEASAARTHDLQDLIFTRRKIQGPALSLTMSLTRGNGAARQQLPTDASISPYHYSNRIAAKKFCFEGHHHLTQAFACASEFEPIRRG